MAVGSRIFISYRRDDASAYAGRLYDGLSLRFPGQVFMDVDTIAPGVDFVERIEESVGSADVLIAVIGRGWASAVDEDGKRRLEQPDDFVRLEVGTALERNIRVIPVLVGGASYPDADELPDDLDGLTRRNGLELRDNDWKGGTQRLVEAIEDVLGVSDAPSEDEEVQQVVEETLSPPQAPPAQVVSLADVIAGSWVVEIRNPMFGQGVMRVNMMQSSPGAGMFEAQAIVGPPGWQARGQWTILPGDHLSLMGTQMAPNPYMPVPQQGPYQVYLQFSSITNHELNAWDAQQEQVIWRRE
jgi:hypothetical protein